jgi:hypothetical protein
MAGVFGFPFVTIFLTHTFFISREPKSTALNQILLDVVCIKEMAASA